MFPIPERMPNFHHYSIRNIPPDPISQSRRLVETIQTILTATDHRLQSPLTTSSSPEDIQLTAMLEVGTLSGKFSSIMQNGEMTVVQFGLPFNPREFLEEIAHHFRTPSVFYSPLVLRRSGIMVPDLSKLSV
jgi:hypothetical protein